jgi:hypothetical protein
MRLNLPRNSCAWKISGTKFFRKSSGKILDTYGMNLQNPDEEIKRLHIPDDGKIFVEVDQYGAEVLHVAYLCPPGNKLRELFDNNIKPHTYVACHIFREQWEKENYSAKFFCSIPISNINKQPQWKDLNQYIKKSDAHNNRYYTGKKTVHSGNYREGEKTFQTVILTESGGKVFIPLNECRRFLYEYREVLVPEIPNYWWPRVEETLRRDHVLYNLFGYPITFTGIRIDDKLIREATSCVPQSTVGVTTNIAQSNIQQRIESDSNFRDVDVLNNKHDSILTQCDIGHEKEVAEMMREYIEMEFTSPFGEKYRMKSEAKAGFNWKDYDENDNPQGLKELT